MPTDPSDRPVLFFIHYLGGSARAWADVERRLEGQARCIPIDMPGFGEDDSNTGHSVTEMADVLASAIRTEAPRGYTLVGHSMGAKIVAVVARRAEDGEAGLAGLERIVLLAGSPPSPEPMDEKQRATMLGWFGSGDAASREEAHGFINQNVSEKLHPDRQEQAVGDVLGAQRTGWRAWLEGGSQEDWSERVGVLQTPTLILAGENDVHLGPEGQRKFSLPHYANGRLVTLPGAKHLLPYECPDEVARLIAEHVR